MTRVMFASSLREKVSGQAQYAGDLIGRGVAVAGVVRSPLPHARVVSIDPSRALAIPGVLAVLTGADFIGIRLGSEIADERVLVDDRARYVGDHVAAVAAEDEDSLRLALAAVDVAYEPLPAALTPDEALALGSPIHEEHPDNVAYKVEAVRGDWDREVAQVALWAEGDFDIRPVHHAYMEPHSIFARYEPGVVTLYTATHSPSKIQEEYEPWVKRGEERLEIRTPAFGGAFGAKYEHPLHLICAEFARRLRRDVGLVLSRREDFLAARPRMDMRLRVRIGADSDGQLLAKSADVLANNGAFSLHGPSLLLAATTRMDNLYRYRAVRSTGRLVYTNTSPTECYRGFGDPEAAFAQEQLIDELARRLGLDPFEIRRRNAVGDGEVTVHGWRVTSTGFAQCLDAVQLGIARDRKEPATDPREVRGEEGRYRFGYGVAPGMHVTSNRGRAGKDFATVTIRVDSGGTPTLFSSEVDVGTGAGRVLARLAAGILGIEATEVKVVLGDTELGPFGLGSYASRTTYFAGNACIVAARSLEQLANRLRHELGIRAAGLPALAAELERLGRLDQLAVTGEFVTEDVAVPDASGFVNRSPAYTFGVHGCKVLVDTWTGQTKVLRYWAAHDAGTVLDLPGANGQVVGGIMQGLGHALSEESVLGPDGRVLNAGFLDYRIPTCLDSVPIEITFSDTYDPGGPLGAKSLAEPPIIPVAACVANAIRDATGVRLDRLPMLPETLLSALTLNASTQVVSSTR